ncbi:MAG TPA: hypothetical protein VHU87_14335 [Rhizomicrobium sp.]|jgi:hypothetical protein|nr:hypothetical protein [Rhizomicrobium sp.]
MLKLTLAAVAVCAVVAGSTIAFADTPNGNGATPPADPNEMICKKGEVTTGSRFPGPTICHTRLEWEQEQKNANESLQGMQNRLDQQRGSSISGGH